jgi:hypothetical protein
MTPRQIRNGAREFEDAKRSTRKQIELTHPRSYQTLTVVLQLTKLPSLPHLGVVESPGEYAYNYKGTVP